SHPFRWLDISRDLLAWRLPSRRQSACAMRCVSRFAGSRQLLRGLPFLAFACPSAPNQIALCSTPQRPPVRLRQAEHCALASLVTARSISGSLNCLPPQERARTPWSDGHLAPRTE